MQRPDLNDRLDPLEFARWYWLKEELVIFCRNQSIASAGAKPEVASRISAHLAGQSYSVQTKRSPKREMPKDFTLQSVIGEGWRCNPSLGAFFKAQCGKRFRFNKAVRDFIHTQVGRNLAEAVACYRASVAPDAPKTQIAPQLEYNRHTREFYEKNPTASRKQVLDAWWVKRSTRLA